MPCAGADAGGRGEVEDVVIEPADVAGGVRGEGGDVLGANRVAFVADRISDEVAWVRRCADWLAGLDAGGYPPAVNLRPAADWPDTAHVAVDLARVRAVLDRIAADLDELARARRVVDLDTAAVLPDRRAEHRHRLAEPDLDFRDFCARKRLPVSSTLHLEHAWGAWQTERHRRGEIDQWPDYRDNPFRPR